MHIADAVVVVTGGGRGIGAAMARAFAASGARVAVIARTLDEVNEVAQEINGLAVAADVRHKDACSEALAAVVKHFGRIDVLVNNAGVAVNKPFVETTEDEYDTIMNTNVKGVFFMTAAVMRYHPRIILTISSGSGKVGYPGLSVYCASKFAVNGFMQAASQETHAKLYLVSPGGVDTRMYQELFDERARVRPEQVADAVVALCQDEPPTGYELELYKML
jgi:3-oxoacyl-[acyl-carrier protein] reductase